MSCVTTRCVARVIRRRGPYSGVRADDDVVEVEAKVAELLTLEA